MPDIKSLDHPDELNAAVEFDSPFRVLPGGRIDPLADMMVYAPERVSDDVAPDGWEFVDGWTGQYSPPGVKPGPTMHQSEYLGGRMARHVLETPGAYCIVLAYVTATTAMVLDDLTDEDANAVRRVLADGGHPADIGPDGVSVVLRSAGRAPSHLADLWTAAHEEADDAPAGWYLLRMIEREYGELVQQIRRGNADGLDDYSRYAPEYSEPVGRWGVVVVDGESAELITDDDRAAVLAAAESEGTEAYGGVACGIADLDTGEHRELAPVVTIPDPFGVPPVARSVVSVERSENGPELFERLDDAEDYQWASLLDDAEVVECFPIDATDAAEMVGRELADWDDDDLLAERERLLSEQDEDGVRVRRVAYIAAEIAQRTGAGGDHE